MRTTYVARVPWGLASGGQGSPEWAAAWGSPGLHLCHVTARHAGYCAGGLGSRWVRQPPRKPGAPLALLRGKTLGFAASAAGRQALVTAAREGVSFMEVWPHQRSLAEPTRAPLCHEPQKSGRPCSTEDCA